MGRTHSIVDELTVLQTPNAIHQIPATANLSRVYRWNHELGGVRDDCEHTGAVLLKREVPFRLIPGLDTEVELDDKALKAPAWT